MRTARLSHLKRRADFLRLAASRRKRAEPGLVLQVAEQPVHGAGGAAAQQADLAAGSSRPPRLGFTASKKVGDAVRRNRAKRRLRAAAGEILGRHGLPGHDYVLIARDGTARRPWPDLLRDLENAVKKLKAWRPD